MNPILLNLPMPIITPRLLMRPFQAGDGTLTNEAITESFEQLNQWMRWAIKKPSVEESEIYCRSTQAEFILRKELPILIFDTKGTLLGAGGYNDIDWNVPKLAIGYWLRTKFTGHGYITEAVNALTSYAFDQLQVARVEIKCDEENVRSRKIAERLGYIQEGCLKNYIRNNQGKLKNYVIYARYDTARLPHLDIKY